MSMGVGTTDVITDVVDSLEAKGNTLALLRDSDRDTHTGHTARGEGEGATHIGRQRDPPPKKPHRERERERPTHPHHTERERDGETNREGKCGWVWVWEGGREGEGEIVPVQQPPQGTSNVPGLPGLTAIPLQSPAGSLQRAAHLHVLEEAEGVGGLKRASPKLGITSDCKHQSA